MSLDLSNMQKLCEAYGHPQNSYPTIHVAGTNGKGSVCTKIAAALEKEGFTTGLYTSPHIETFYERIQINRQVISKDDTLTLLREVQERIVALNMSATFFEIATLLAFLHFRNKKVDVAVIETGLGGRLDATNVITPLLSVITSIGLDHTNILGGSINEIACEKAGIIKKGIPVIIGPDVPYEFMKKKASELDCSLLQNMFRHENFDRENQETARLALFMLRPHFSVSEETLKTELQAKPPCRFEQHKRAKDIVFDVAHNGHGFLRLLQMLEYTYPNHDYRFVVGFSKDKDINECACAIQQKSHAIHLVSSPHPRLAKVQEIQPFFTSSSSPVLLENNIAQGIQNALKAYNQKPEVLIIAGSFFIMSEARKTLDLYPK